GLGDRFLQHVERTRVLAYLVPLEAADPQAAYDLLRSEAGRYSPALAAKPHIVVLSKNDLLGADQPVPRIYAPDASAVLSISAVANRGLSELKERLWSLLAAERADVEPDPIE